MRITLPQWLKKIPLTAILLLLLLSYYLLLTSQTIKLGLQTPENLYYLSKIMLELKTPYFYFLDLNTYQPPLPYFAALLFRNPYAAATATGVFFALFVYWFLRGKKYIEIIMFLLFAFFFLYLPLLYLFTSKLQLALYFCIFCISNFFLVRFIKNRKTYDIFYFGLLYGLSYFTLYEAVYLLPLYLLIIFVCTPGDKLDYKMSLVLVAFMPILFMFLAWSYLCWLYTGQAALLSSSTPFYMRFMVYTSASRIVGNVADVFVNSFRYAFIFYAIFPLLFFEKKFLRSPLIYVYLSPLLLLLVKTISWGFAPEFHEYTILFLVIPIVFYFVNLESLNLKALLPVGLALFLIIGNIAFYNYGNPYESQFAKVIARQGVEVKPQYYIEVSAILNSEAGRILMDDDILHPIIIYTDDVNRFILPYNLEFKTGLNDPAVLADHIVMTVNPYADRVAQIWPPDKGIPGFSMVYNHEGIYLFSKTREVKTSKK